MLTQVQMLSQCLADTKSERGVSSPPNWSLPGIFGKEARAHFGTRMPPTKCHQSEISPSTLPSKYLDGDAQIRIKTNGIHYAPTLQAEPFLRLVESTRLENLN